MHSPQLILIGLYAALIVEADAASAWRVDPGYPLQGPASGPVYSISPVSSGVRYLAGDFFSLGATSNLLGVAGVDNEGNLTAAFAGGEPAFGTRGRVCCVHAFSGGQVVAGGDFGSIGVQELHGLAWFDPPGRLRTGYPTAWLDEGASVHALASDGEVVYVGGAFSGAGGSFSGLAKLDREGNWMPEFKVQAGETGDGIVRTLLILPDRRILCGGSFSRINGQPATNLACISPDGRLTSSPFQSLAPDGDVLALALDGQGRIYIGGGFGVVQGDERFAGMARLHSDGQLDVSFIPRDSVNSDGIDGYVQAIQIFGAGGVLAGGEFEIGGESGLGNVALFREDGSLDRAFDIGLPATRPEGPVFCLAVEGNGAVLIGGEFRTLGGSSHPYLARILGVANVPPQVSIRSPVNFAKAKPGLPLLVTMDVLDPDDSQLRVELVNTVSGAVYPAGVGTPHVAVVNEDWAGALFLQARATDARGGVGVSPMITIIQDLGADLSIHVMSQKVSFSLLGSMGWSYDVQGAVSVQSPIWNRIRRVDLVSSNSSDWEIQRDASPRSFYRAVVVE